MCLWVWDLSVRRPSKWALKVSVERTTTQLVRFQRDFLLAAPSRTRTCVFQPLGLGWGVMLYEQMRWQRASSTRLVAAPSHGRSTSCRLWGWLKSACHWSGSVSRLSQIRLSWFVSKAVQLFHKDGVLRKPGSAVDPFDCWSGQSCCGYTPLRSLVFGALLFKRKAAEL